MMVECKKYKAFHSAKTCILRVKRVVDGGSAYKNRTPADPGCAECKTGKKLYKQYLEGEFDMNNLKVTRKKELKIKNCPKCKEDKPADTDHFYNDGKSASGLSCWCKDCQAAATRDRDKKKRKTRGTRLVKLPVRSEKEEPFKKQVNKIKSDILLTLDFSEHEDLLATIKGAADDEFRTPAMQVLWWLSTHQDLTEAV